MASFASRLSETADVSRRAVAPVAEWIVQHLTSTVQKQRTRSHFSTTRLTQNKRREVQGGVTQPDTPTPPRLERICCDCGKTISRGQRRCEICVRSVRAQRMIGVAQQGRMYAHSNAAQASRSATQQRHNTAIRNWKPSENPAWMTEQSYRDIIRPRLTNVRNSDIARALGVSFQYAMLIRRGERRPHPRHWQVLADLVGFQ